MHKLMTKTQLIKDLELDSLFTGSRTLILEGLKELFAKSIKYDNGKYDTDTSSCKVETKAPIWYARRKDSNGAYVQLFCIDDAALSSSEYTLYRRILDVWNA